MTKMDLKNIRDPEQLSRMKKLKSKGECHFCGDITKKHTAPVIYRNNKWFVVANDFPYTGSTHHYLIVPTRHITKLTDLSTDDQLKLFDAIGWLEKKLGVKGFSVFVRSGDMSYTGATLDHIHFHFIVGKKRTKNTEWLMVTLGYKKK